MDVDFEELKGICDDFQGLDVQGFLSFPESHNYDIQEVFEKLKSMTIEEIEGTWNNAADAIAQTYIDDIINGEFDDEEIDAVKDEFRAPYLNEYPEKEENWDEDEFVAFLQRHNQYEAYTGALQECAQDFFANSSLIDEAINDCIIKVSETLELPVAVIAYLKEEHDFGD